MLAISLYAYREYFNNEVTYVESKVDMKKYLVCNMPDKEHAADLLATLQGRLRKFVAGVSRANPEDDRVKRLRERFRSTVISESTPTSKYTSYTVNKGSKVVMCVRQRDEENHLVDMNTLVFVALHELAHIMTLSRGHKPEFWTNFKFLLEHAVKNGYYTYHPYHVRPQKYCGTTISDTPLK
jgi:hypothetical protein